MSEKTIALPTPEALIELVGPEVVNLLGLIKLTKQCDRRVVVQMSKAVHLPEAYGLEVRPLFGAQIPFGALVLGIETVPNSDGWCYLKMEPYGAFDEEYFRTHWDALFGAIKPLLDEAGMISSRPCLGGASFVVPS